jgi:glycine C-acetyltransferase
VYGAVREQLAQTLREIEEAGLYKRERQITTPQSAHIGTSRGDALNMCANNYLGLAAASGRSAGRAGGAGASGATAWPAVRFICGTQAFTRSSRRALSDFLGTEDTILYGLVLRRERRPL